MKKKFLFLMALLAVSLLALAEEHVYVYKKNGENVHYVAAELDSIGFGGATTGEYRGHEWVDFGLPSGTLWATSNVRGKYTWGDIRADVTDNKWRKSSSYTKYNSDDKKTILELEDDAAHMLWGGDWRMPTKEEMEELFKYCTLSIVGTGSHNEVDVYIVSNINGKKLKIISESLWNAVTYTLWWSSTKGSTDTAYGIYVNIPQYQNPKFSVQEQFNSRYNLAYIRPVIPGKKTKGVMLHANSSKETKLIEAEHGDVITIPTNPFVRSGYDFIGWNTKADCSGTFYTESTILSVSLPMNLYAQWIKKPTDTEISEGFIDLGLPSGTKWAICDAGASSPEKAGTISTSSQGIAPSVDEVKELISNCTKTSIVINGVQCYLFTSKVNGSNIILRSADYWSRTYNGGTAYYWDHSGSTITATTIAKYPTRPVKHDKLIITFDANSGSGTMEKIEEYQNNVISIPKSTFVRDGYYFSNWNTEADGTGTSYADKSKVTLKSNMTLYAQWRPAEDTGIENGYEWVDLGLPSGTKWATMNVGATKIEDMGESFAWGETEAKTTYDWTTYKWCNGSSSSLTKYNTGDSYDIFVDNKTILELPDDAAYVHWGGNWRIPTKEAVSELFESDYCTWTQTYQNGQYGVKVSSKINGNSIFLPSEYSTYINYDGTTSYELQTDYHTNSLNKEQPYYQYSYRGKVLSYSSLRSNAKKVRPILPLSFTTITFDANGGDGTMDKFAVEKGIIRNIPRATFFHDGYYFVGWNTKADGTGVSYANSGEIKPGSDMTLYAQWKPTEKENGHEWVDLGLPSGTKWATCNIGADKPEEVGELFSWGELEPKSEYSWSTYKWCNGAENKMTKYCNLTKYGTVDMRSRLELVDDAARTNWGSDWRMPSKVEYEELLNEMYCTWTLTTLNGIQGYKVTSKRNDAHIFIPLKSCWTRDLDSNNNKAYVLSITEDRNSVGYVTDRCNARSIRPILK